MESSDNRKQYTEELMRATEQRADLRDFFDKSKSLTERLAPLIRPLEFEDETDIVQSVSIVRDKDEDAQIRVSALNAIGIETGKRHDLIELVIEILGDAGEPAALRIMALDVLQRNSFSSDISVSMRSQYMAALRSVVEDKNFDLRYRATEILAMEKDEFIQRRLLDGLTGRSKRLMGPTKAIQLLGYDIHAEHYPMLRAMVQNPPSQAAKKEAMRLLAADASSAPLLTEILRNKGEKNDVRRISAAALQSIAPEEFESHAIQIVLGDDEDDVLRATLVNALELYASPASLSQDARLNEKVQEFSDSSTSRDLKHAAVRYIAKHIS